MNLWENGGGYTSTHQDWRTPQDFFNRLNKEFSFTLDAAATEESAKCEKFFTAQNCGLSQSWEGETVFLNPPYSDVGTWMKKAAEEGSSATVAALVFARTDTRWFHDHVLPTAAEIRFIKGRLSFFREGKRGAAPAPSMLVIFRPRKRATRVRVTTMTGRTGRFRS